MDAGMDQENYHAVALLLSPIHIHFPLAYISSSSITKALTTFIL